MMATSHNLKQNNFKILFEGCNGLEIFQYVKKNSNKKLDLILLDLDMPIMNGYEACK